MDRIGDNVYCLDPTHPAYRPGPHRDVFGRLRPAVGSLREMLRRGTWGDPLTPFGTRTRERLIATLIEDPDFAAALRSIVEGAA